MELHLQEGLSHTSSVTVSEVNSAKHWGSGKLDVFATPAMIALMENAAMNAVAAALPEGADTVGTEVQIAHNKATGLGETVIATATLIRIEGRKLIFEVSATDSEGEIGRGIHTRFVVEEAKFMAKFKK